MKKKSFKSFKDISDVCESFDLEYEKKDYINSKKITLNSYFIDKLNEFFEYEGSFSSEAAICERIIFPILYEIAREYNLPVWSQLQFTVDKSLGLTGVPDFIIAPALRGNQKYKLPIVCLGEAKKDDFTGGWGQVGAEMYAAQLANVNKIREDKEKNNQIFNKKLESKIKNITIYGLVSNGTDWEFGKLENNNFIINKSKIIAPDNLQKVFDTLNWMFCEARKNADQLLMMNS